MFNFPSEHVFPHLRKNSIIWVQQSEFRDKGIVVDVVNFWPVQVIIQMVVASNFGTELYNAR